MRWWWLACIGLPGCLVAQPEAPPEAGCWAKLPVITEVKQCRSSATVKLPQPAASVRAGSHDWNCDGSETAADCIDYLLPPLTGTATTDKG